MGGWRERSRVAPSRALRISSLGCTVLLMAMAAAPAARAQVETVLYSFAGSPDGATPYAGLVMDASGNLYGTTAAGGASRELTQFEGKKIANRTYTIDLGSIGAGEYGFLPPGAVLSSSGGSVGKMYTRSAWLSSGWLEVDWSQGGVRRISHEVHRLGFSWRVEEWTELYALRKSLGISRGLLSFFFRL